MQNYIYVGVTMFEPISIDLMTSEMLRQTENSLISEVARKLLENQEERYHCDYLVDSVFKLHESFNVIVPVLKCTGRISIDALHNVCGAISDLHSMLYVVYAPDEIYTVSEYSNDYQLLEHYLKRVDKLCKTIVVSDWDDNNPGNSEMRSAAMRCVSSLLDCVNFIKDALFERLNFEHDYHSRIMELMRISKEFRE